MGRVYQTKLPEKGSRVSCPVIVNLNPLFVNLGLSMWLLSQDEKAFQSNDKSPFLNE